MVLENLWREITRNTRHAHATGGTAETHVAARSNGRLVRRILANLSHGEDAIIVVQKSAVL